jgi:uncharacterized protein (TIRG00374 family)
MEGWMNREPGIGYRTVILIVAAAVILGLLLVVLDCSQVRQVLVAANWRLLPLALLFTAIALSCLAASYVLVCRIFGIGIGYGQLFEVGLVANILNHLMPTGTLAGYSLGLAVVRRRGLSLSDAIGASLFHGYISSLIILAGLPVGLLYLSIAHPLSPQVARGIAAAAAVFMVLMVLATALIVRAPLRRKLLARLGRAWLRLRGRDVSPALDAFDQTMSRGVDAMRAAPLVTVGIFALSLCDWAGTLMALHYCFRALGPAPSIGVLVTGFIIGIAAGSISLLPGGLGVQEGSMAGMYHLLGVSLEQAALAAILFRAIYSLAPFLLTLPLYAHLLRANAAAAPEQGDNVSGDESPTSHEEGRST